MSSINVLPRFSPNVDRMRVDKKYFEQGYHYRYANTSIDERVEFLKSIGYEVVFKKGADGKPTSEPVSVSNCILMRCRLEEYKKREALKLEIARTRIKAPRERVKEFGAERGVEVIDETRETSGSLESGLGED